MVVTCHEAVRFREVFAGTIVLHLASIFCGNNFNEASRMLNFGAT
jgi:hypothetical protein